MHQPPSYVDSVHPDYVCKLHKSLYGLKQALRAWFERFAFHLLHLVFIALVADRSLFIFCLDMTIIYLLLYVDDIIVTGNDSSQIASLIAAFSPVFEIKDLGDLHYFLGIQITPSPHGLLPSQSKYASDILHRFHIESAKPTKTPCCPSTRLVPSDGVPLLNPIEYRSMVGALQYLTFTRPDFAFSVHQLCQFMSHPTFTHLEIAKQVIRYIRAPCLLGFLSLLVLCLSLLFQLQIRLGTLLTNALLLVCLFFLGQIPYLGLSRNRILCLVPPQNQSITPQPPLQLSCPGFAFYLRSFASFFIIYLLSGAKMFLPLPCLHIPFSTLGLNTLKLIIILLVRRSFINS